MIATYYGPAFLLVIASPFILGVLWLLPLVSSISLFSRRSPMITRRLFKTSAWLTLVFAVIGVLMVQSDEREKNDPMWLWLLGVAVLPGVLGYFYSWAARRTHGRPPEQPTPLLYRARVVMSLGILSWIAVATFTAYLPIILWP